MITMNELVDLRMQQHIAQEIYRQQIIQRIPDPFPQMLSLPMSRHVIMPPRITLPGVKMTLQNDDLWKQFHGIGTEMIITKSGRRMFPSMRLSLSGLEDETNYCVVLEMMPIGDCRYKFSGSQWVPAGGAEPQSPQRMYLHPDSPASGAHWQAQPILFNRMKLTNNTLDINGHIVLASMHKYQPRIHMIRTSDLTHIPWAPQQAFVFSETEFVAVTAYQNDRITKLKIENNPFAKGFRETGQSRCKRKMSLSPSKEDKDQELQPLQWNDMSPTKSTLTGANDSGSSICAAISPLSPPIYTLNSSSSPVIISYGDIITGEDDESRIKRIRSNGSSACSVTSLDYAMTTSAPVTGPIVEISSHNMLYQKLPNVVGDLTNDPPSLQHTRIDNGNDVVIGATSVFMHHLQQNMQTLLRPSLVDLACISYFDRAQPTYAPLPASTQQTFQPPLPLPIVASLQHQTATTQTAQYETPDNENNSCPSKVRSLDNGEETRSLGHKKKSFSISAILGSTN